jgi:hypothetical protein
MMIIYAMRFYNFSSECCVNVKLLISISYSLSKVFRCDFLITTRKVEILESCPVRDKARARKRIIGSIIS